MIVRQSFAQSTESFAAERKSFLTESEDALRPHIAEALSRVGLPQWGRPIVAQALDIFDRTARAEVDAWNPILDDMHDAFAEEMADTLQKTTKVSAEQFDAQVERLTRWVATMAVNAGTEAATTSDPSEGVGLEWITMGDSDVRHTHQETNGQVVPTGQPFTVGEVEMLYPGQPVGDPENWINCRCVVRPTMLDGFTSATITASGDLAEDQVAEEPITSTVIVALPASDDPISAASSERSGAHATLLFFGDSSAVDEKALNEAVQNFITRGEVGIITEQVNGRATLGADAADVVLFDAANLVFIRSGLLEDPVLLAAYDAVEQFPTWLPHVTLGYPETPAAGEFSGEAITFDRLAVWHGESRTEYPLGGTVVPTEEPQKKVIHPEDPGFTQEMADAAFAATDPLPVEPEPTEEEAIKDEEEAWQAAQDEDMNPTIPWHGVLAPEGTPSGDGRQFGLNALTNRDLPLPLKAMTIDDEGHKGSFIVGRIDRIFREGNLVKGEGVFDTTPDAYEAVRKLAEKMWRGVSVDVDAVEAAMFADSEDPEAPEIVEFSKARIASATLCAIPAFAEAYVALGTWADAAADAEVSDVGHPAEVVDPAKAADLSGGTEDFEISVPTKTKDGPGWITEPAPTKRITGYWVDGRGAAKIGWGAPGDFNRCRTQLAKYVANPDWLAGLCANLHYRALGVWPGQAAGKVEEMSDSTEKQSMSLVASAAPKISADYFRNPMLTEPTPVTRGEDGHIFGHLATWDTCHIGFEVCTTAPPSQTDYAYFLTGQVFTDAGPVAVGQLTVGGGHAADGISLRAAVSHYDNVSTAVADITVGEDEFGVWFSGKIRDWATEQQVHELFAAGPSGDWRGVRVGGRESLELVAAHAVNVQGFPIGRSRTRFAMEGDRQVSLVAAGHVEPKSAITPEFRAAMAEFVAENNRKARAEQLRANVRAFKAESIKSKINQKKVS